jgi:hypothetical protein
VKIEEFLRDIERDECRLALRQVYGCDARFCATVAICIPVRGREPWRGSVHLFNLYGHALATRGYAWPRPINTRTTIIHTALQSEACTSPEQAVRNVLVRRNARRLSRARRVADTSAGAKSNKKKNG